MAGSINKVILVGNLGRDPEVRTMGNGGKVVQLNLATSESWKDKNTGERRDKTEWHRVVIFNENLGRVAEQYLRKGSTVYVEGQLQTRKWTDQSGQEKYTTEVVLQRYRGELTMLGARAGAGAGMDSGGFDDGSYGGGYDSGPQGGDGFGGGNSGSNSGSSSGSQGGGFSGPSGNDLDDEIPF